MADTPLHALDHRISFQDCDPAGIVFYPRFLALFDRTFHDWLRQFGGHQQICAEMGSIGLGLMHVAADFRNPALDGDLIRIEMQIARWGSRSLELSYRIVAAKGLIATGQEVRGAFTQTPDGLRAGDIGALRRIVGAGP